MAPILLHAALGAGVLLVLHRGMTRSRKHSEEGRGHIARAPDSSAALDESDDPRVSVGEGCSDRRTEPVWTWDSP